MFVSLHADLYTPGVFLFICFSCDCQIEIKHTINLLYESWSDISGAYVIIWILSGRDCVREDMVKLFVDGKHALTGRYTYSLVHTVRIESNMKWNLLKFLNSKTVLTQMWPTLNCLQGFCRRTYEYLLTDSPICLVHYRLCPIEELPKKAALSSVSNNSMSRIKDENSSSGYTWTTGNANEDDILDDRVRFFV